MAEVLDVLTLRGPRIVVQGVGAALVIRINVPIGLIAIPPALARLDESLGEDTAGWASLEVVGALTAGALLVAAFVAWELRARRPMLPMSPFRSRAFSAAGAVSFFLFAALYGAVFVLAQVMQTGLGRSPLEAGLLLVPRTATLIVGRADRRRPGRPDRRAAAGGRRPGPERRGSGGDRADRGAGLGHGPLLAALLAALLVTGIGASATTPVVQSAMIGGVAEGEVGKASGADNMTQELGGALGVAILGTSLPPGRRATARG